MLCGGGRGGTSCSLVSFVSLLLSASSLNGTGDESDEEVDEDDVDEDVDESTLSPGETSSGSSDIGFVDTKSSLLLHSSLSEKVNCYCSSWVCWLC